MSLEQITKENNVLRPFKKAVYAFRPEKAFLDEEQYAHIVNKKTGQTILVEGPAERVLRYDERIVGDIEQKIILTENEYAIISNPINNQGKVLYGEREVRKGPQKFSLRPGEKIEKQPTKEHVLTKYDALLVKAREDFDNRKAGDKFLVKGPTKYVPSKHEDVLERITAISLSDTDGIYVQNNDTGEVSLVKGPTDYFLQPNESFYEKEITKEELQALGLEAQVGRDGVRVLTRQAANKSFLEDRTKALVLELEDNEIVFLYDGTDTRIEKGPKTTFLGPYERPKVLNLSGGRPIQPNALKVALLKLGPDFIYDQISVRTKDNAQLLLNITYKWRFKTENNNHKKHFSLEDFVGYTAETLSSEIRGVAAKYDFEEFHAKAFEYIKGQVFGQGNSKLFDENNLEIFGIDITAINPKDPKIAEKLHDAIKNNMDIYCKKITLKATLESERQELEGKKQIEKERGELIKSTNENDRLLSTEQAKIQAEAEKIRAESQAASTKIVNDAEIESEKKRLNTVIGELGGSKEYLALQRAKALENVEKLIVPENSRILIGNNGGFNDDN
ncbi:hypothetical protein HZA97_09735 [Candidatus Woesearchaeota archaeon]|nr:hypothetical protein [Candidatus Woesearchaeota archaeon]